MDKEQRNEATKYYEERRSYLNGIRDDSIESFDKTILQVSTGALVITITFIDKIGKPYDLLTNILSILLWSFFLVVILLNIASYRFAVKNMDFKINDLDERYKKSPDDWQSIPEGFSKYKKTTENCDKFALYFFILGVIIFFSYAVMVQAHNYESLTKGYVMTDDKKTSVKRVQDGKTETSEKQTNKNSAPVKQPEKTQKK